MHMAFPAVTRLAHRAGRIFALQGLVSQKCILVADDEESIRTLVVRALSLGQYRVESATDGAEAIDLLKTRTYDALVLDLMMPSVSGLGVLEYLSEHQPDLRARTVVITAAPKAVTAELTGLCDILTKPFDIDQLRSAIARCVRLPVR